MTIIDEMVLRFNLDPTGFNRAQQQTMQGLRKLEEEARSAGKGTEDAAQKMVDGFSRVTKEVLGLGAAFLGVNGLKDLVAGTVNAGSALQVQAKSFNIASEAANRYANAVKIAGGSSDAALQSFTQVALKLQRVQAGDAGPEILGQQWLQILGINPFDYDAKHPEKFISDVVRGANALPDKRAAIMTGTGLEAFMPLANLGSGDLAKLLSESLSLTQQQAENARNISASVERLVVALETRANQVILGETVTKAATGAAMVATDVVRGDFTKAVDDAQPLLSSSPWWAFGSPLAGPLAMKWVWDKLGRPGAQRLGLDGAPSAPDDALPAPPIPRGRPNAGTYSSSDVGRDADRYSTGGVGTGKWIAPYVHMPLHHETLEAGGFGQFRDVNTDNSHAVHIGNVNITPPPGTDANDWGRTFMSSVTSQASSGSR